MRLFDTPQVQAAMLALRHEIEREAETAGESVHVLAISAFTKEDPTEISTAIEGCSCSACMTNLSNMLKEIGAGQIEPGEEINAVELH